MAIQFARARYISRSDGGSAVRSAAYNSREAITAERTGELYYFRHRDAPEHHEVLLAEGTTERFRESSVLWNTAEAAEKRKDSQVAREIVLALPSNAAITSDDRIELARSFAAEHFVTKGLAVQLDVHAPHEGAAAGSERANWHAHLLVTTRRLEGDRFAAKKARDLDPEVRRAGAVPVVAEGAAWGELWRDHQNRYFREHGLDLEVDPTATYAAPHIGPVRMRVAGSEIAERAEQVRQANEQAVRDPAQVLETLTRHNATFSERDLDRYLAKHLDDEAAAECATVKTQVLKHENLVPLYDRESGEAAGRFTTRQVREQEQRALVDATAIAVGRPAVPEAMTQTLRVGRGLRPDQQAAFDYATGSGGLKIIEGRAGTGKSYALGVIREAHELAGDRVVGLAPTNTVAQDLKEDGGFAEASTVHAELFRLKNGRAQWNTRTVLVVDEAAMLDSRVTGELLAGVRGAGAKLILAGDDHQLASIERGGLFSELKQRHGAAEITEVTRQRVDWQRQAAHDLAEGRFADAVAAYDRAGAITWTQGQEAARSALVEAWKRDTGAEPRETRFVFAYTNRDVDALNAELRHARHVRGELSRLQVRLETRHGEAEFAVGDRVQFTDTDKRARIYNGNAGTITGVNAHTGVLWAVLDSGREVSWSAAQFPGFRHGYAGTIYKGQGKTLDHTYLYHTHHWRQAASYVALTRQRESAQVFVARETAKDTSELARQMARGEVKAASVAWATREEVVERAEQIRRANEEAARDPAQVLETLTRHNATFSERDLDRYLAKHLDEAAAERATVKKQVLEHENLVPLYDRESGERAGRFTTRQVREQEQRALADAAAIAVGRPAVPEPAAQTLRVGRAHGEVKAASVAWATREKVAEPTRGLSADPSAQREALRRELLALDSSALAEAARADRVGTGRQARPMTLADAVHLISRDYVAAADRVSQLRQQSARLNKFIQHSERELRFSQEEGDRRWRQMGFVRKVLDKTGARRDFWLSESNRRQSMALKDLTELNPRRDELAQQLADAEKAEADALRQAEPAATAELARRRERAALARDITDEQSRQASERQETLHTMFGQEQATGPGTSAEARRRRLRETFAEFIEEPAADPGRAEARRQRLRETFAEFVEEPAADPGRAEARRQRLRETFAEFVEKPAADPGRAEARRQRLREAFAEFEKPAAQKTPEQIRQAMQEPDKPARERRQGKDHGQEIE